MNASDIIVQATMATAIVKGLIDLLRMCWGGNRESQPPHWAMPIAALLIGPAIIALLNISVHADLTDPATIGKVMLAGFMTTLSAIGITELHNQANPAAPSLVTPMTPGPPVVAVPTAPPAAPYSYAPPPTVPTTTAPFAAVPPWQQPH